MIHSDLQALPPPGPMGNLASEFGRELVETQRRLSAAQIRIGKLEAELEETSRQLALAEVQLGRTR